MTQMADRYYVVWKGRKPGIYETWKTCEAQVKGYGGAEYKSYRTREAAERAYKDEDGPGATFIREELGQELTPIQVGYLKAREREVEQEREGERKNAGACVGKRKSRPLIPDDPRKYTAATKEALARVLGRTDK